MNSLRFSVASVTTVTDIIFTEHNTICVWQHGNSHVYKAQIGCKCHHRGALLCLPNGVDGLNLAVAVVARERMLGEAVGEQAGLPQQRPVAQLSSCQLLVSRLQAQQEHAVSKTDHPQKRTYMSHALLPSHKTHICQYWLANAAIKKINKIKISFGLYYNNMVKN